MAKICSVTEFIHVLPVTFFLSVLDLAYDEIRAGLEENLYLFRKTQTNFYHGKH